MATAKTARVVEPAEQASAAMRDNMDRGLAALSEVSAFGKQNVEAWLASATAAQKGLEALSARTVAFQKQAIENHVAATKALMGSKSVQEFVEKQNDYAKSSFEAYIAELSSMSEMMSGLAKDAMQPLNERVNAVGHLMQNGAVR
jgi:phasin family protein